MGNFTVRPFRPAWWLRGGHAQTIGGRFLRRRLSLDLRRERLETPDGDFVDLDFGPEAPGRRDAPLVVILHGLEGGSRSGYALATLRSLREWGAQGVVLNFRSCGGEMNRLPRFYHAGDTADLEHVLGWLAERRPDAPLGAIGFSLGGNVLLKYLGERGGAARQRLRAAAAVSVPFDLAAGADRLERGMGRIYTAWFMRNLMRKSRAKAATIGDRCDLEALSRARTLREFDDRATAPLHGFRDAGHYYAESSSAGYLHGIRVPTLLLHSLDDPFLPADAVPRGVADSNPQLTEAFTARGGHVGFVGGQPWAPELWAEREAARFVTAHLRCPEAKVQG